jgi:hypothetical protein
MSTSSRRKLRNVSRVYADANAKRPKEYWNYEALNVEWGYAILRYCASKGEAFFLMPLLLSVSVSKTITKLFAKLVVASTVKCLRASMYDFFFCWFCFCCVGFFFFSSLFFFVGFFLGAFEREMHHQNSQACEEEKDSS